MWVSNCCDAPNRGVVALDGPDYFELDMCPACKERCEFINLNDEFGDTEKAILEELNI